MKRRLALGALLVLAGVVSLGALLMWGPFGSTPEASATQVSVDLVQGPKHNDVGDVLFTQPSSGAIQVVFTPAEGQRLEEVHVCISEADSCLAEDMPGKIPPGRCPWKVESSDPDWNPDRIEVNILPDDPNWPEGVECGSLLWIQAHAVVVDTCTGAEETAYGETFKGSFCAQLCCWP